ncbi:MAG: COX15/CtaA family protein [Chromatiales bacterium]|nr:COX15/CtaA family protein [Chromatiales bacterium]
MIVFAALALAAIVVPLGAYVRLSDAGLGCPDWPGCYGQIGVPEAAHHIEQANLAYPERPVEAAKAWKEMIHRYFAGALGLLILVAAIVAIVRRRLPDQPVALPVFLLLLVIFQAALGMWTVTWLLKPAVVTAHLIGGMATLGLLAWLALRVGRPARLEVSAGTRWLARAALVVVIAQITLGGWVSTNYAAIICDDFPTCQGRWWPPMDFADAFHIWRGLGIDYEGGVLGNDARVAVQMTHRIGALVTLLFAGLAAVGALRARSAAVRGLGVLVGVALGAQIALGIGNVLLDLPLSVAVAHNAVAAALLLSLIWLNYVYVRAPE